MRKLSGIIALGLMLASPAAHAGYIVLGATVTHVYTTSGNGAVFGVTVTGGSGPCTGSTFTILFPVSAAPDADTHKRAYAAALMALAMGLRVDIHNYSSDACDGASYISIYN